MKPVIAAALIALASSVTHAQAQVRDWSGEPAITPVPGGLQMSDFIARFFQDKRDAERFFDQPWSERAFDQWETIYLVWEARLSAVDFELLDEQSRIDYVLLKTAIRASKDALALDRKQLAEMDALLPFRRDILELVWNQLEMKPVDSEASATRLSKLPDVIKDTRSKVRAPKKDEKEGAQQDDAAKPDDSLVTSPVLARRAASACSSLRRALNEWYRFHSAYEPEFAWWVQSPYDKAGKAIDDYEKFLRENIAGLKGEDNDPLVGDPIGRDALAAQVGTELLPFSIDEMIEIGEQELAWCHAEMERAARDMGLEKDGKGDWHAALERVKMDHVPPGDQDELVVDQSLFVIDWLKQRDLVTIPPLCEQTWTLQMISPDQQKTLPFAVYFGQSMGVSYPGASMTHEDKQMSMRGNNRHFTRIVTPHELIPGHHLQRYMADRVRPYRRSFSTPFFVEGWALYWEMTFWELGYPRTPEERMGMLFWRAHRAARIIVSLKFHLGEMTPDQMIDFLVEQVGHERFTATSEVRRFIGGDYSPLYQCGYMIGGLQLRALREELVKTGKMSEREFHDRVLSYGPIPMSLIARDMLGESLTP